MLVPLTLLYTSLLPLILQLFLSIWHGPTTSHAGTSLADVLPFGLANNPEIKEIADSLTALWNRGESGTGITHGEGGGTGSSLGLDDLCLSDWGLFRAVSRTVTAELDSLDESLVLLSLDVGTLAGLAQEGDDGDTRVTADDSDVDVLRVGALDLSEESRGSDDIKRRDTEESLLVEDTGLLEDLGEDWDGGVDRVGDDEDVSLGRVLSNGLGEVSDDRGVGVLV